MVKKKNIVAAPREMTHRQLSHHKRQQRRQRIIFYGGISIITAVVIIIILGWVFSEYRPLHKTVFKVYDTSIPMSNFIDTLKLVQLPDDASQLPTLANNVANQIISNELLRHGAEGFDVVVSDEEVNTALKNAGLPDNEAAKSLIRVQLLTNKVKSDYFGAKIPASDNQVYMMTMLVESENLVPEIRARLESGDNFTTLAEQYGWNYTTREVNKGDYGWHPATILKDLLGSDIPINWAFNAAPGEISPALIDTEAYKKLGYWLLRVNDIPEAGTANVSAVLVSSKFEAKELKMRLENGSENLTAIADTYSQYSLSKEQHGELGVVEFSENISDNFNGYVFNKETQLGKWSEPIQEETFYTKGGAWIVRLVDKETNRALSDADKNTLIEKAYGDWSNGLWVTASADIINNLTEEDQQWAIDRAIKEIKKS